MVGWQHGPVPKAPTNLLKVSRDVWAVWMGSWFAAHWEPEDLPGLYLVVRLYDQVQRGQLQRAAELRIQMDAYGMTPKGQQDRRWKRQEPEEAPAARAQGARYGHLRPVPPAAARARRRKGA
jgi:hypothetical protein